MTSFLGEIALKTTTTEKKAGRNQHHAPVRLKGKNIFGFCTWSTVILHAFPQLKSNSLIVWGYSPLLSKWLEILSRFCACREKLSQERARRHNGRIFRRKQVQRSFACCEHGFCLLRLSQCQNLLLAESDWLIMSEITEYESKSKFAGRPTEKNANMSGKMQKSRKRKRASKPVRRVKKMRLEKEVRKSNSFWNCRKVVIENRITVFPFKSSKCKVAQYQLKCFFFCKLFACDKTSSTESFFCSYLQLFLDGQETSKSKSILER